MDILDVLLAQAMTPENAARIAAQKAVNDANQAINDAQLALDSATSTIADVEEAAQKVINIDINHENNENYSLEEVTIGNDSAQFKNYHAAGNNEDGSMTQKAIKNFVSEEIKNSRPNLGRENSGNIVVIDEIGEIVPGAITEADLIRTQILTGTYRVAGAYGVEIDYENKSFTRINPEEAMPVHEKILRCLVDDNGEIISFYGDPNYSDNYASGYQTMVYIPKFYYMRIPLEMNDNMIKKECVMISETKQSGFKVHPIFLNKNDEELDYFLYSAYEGSTFSTSANAYNRSDGEIDFTTDKLASIVEAKPISGKNNELNIANAEKLANNRGENWHITSIKAESAIQLLFLTEFCKLNGQTALESGVSDVPGISGLNCASYTGSTSSLGNTTGAATSTINERDGIEYTYNINGRRAINFHGIENPWGNIWRFVNGIYIQGNGTQQGGIAYVCDGLDCENDSYISTNIILPNTSGWISNFGYNNRYDWLFIPTSINGGNSSLPVGDYVWVKEDLNGRNAVVMGGHWAFKENNGLFYYGFDKSQQYSDRSFSARLMYIPSINEIYRQNVLLWGQHVGG